MNMKLVQDLEIAPLSQNLASMEGLNQAGFSFLLKVVDAEGNDRTVIARA